MDSCMDAECSGRSAAPSSRGEADEVEQTLEKSESCADAERSPRCFVVVFNLASKHNIGTLIRTAVAFGVYEIVLVGNVCSAWRDA